MSSPPRPTAGEGLGRTAPLVTIAGGPPNSMPASAGVRSNSQQQNLTPAAGNHPLAPPPSRPPPPPPPPPPQQHQLQSQAQTQVSVGIPFVQSSEAVQSVEVSLPTGGTSAPTNNIYSTPSGSFPPPPPPPVNPLTPPRSNPPVQQQQQQQQTFPSPPPAAVTTASYNQYASPPPQSSSTSTPSNFSSPVQSLDDLVDAFLSGPSYRTQQGLPPLLRPPPLTSNEEPLQTLRTLVERRAWGDVLQVAADLLRGPDSVYAPIYSSMLFDGTNNSNNNSDNQSSRQHQKETAEIVALQCHAWLKLRRYTDLGQEIERWNFLSFNDNCNPSNADGDPPSSWVPWSLHIIAAETLIHTTDDPNRGTDELYAILSRIPDSEDIRWKLCTYRALANAFSRKREWRLAMVAVEQMLQHVEEATRQEVVSSASSNTTTTIVSSVSALKLLETAYRTELISIQGRYLLHAGAVAEAARLFQDAQTDWNQIKKEADAEGTSSEVDNHIVVQHIPAQLLANEGLLCFAYANYDQAIECFKNATDTLRSFNLSPVYRSQDWVGPSVIEVAPHPMQFNECINNMAICALYTCRMPEAVNLMESLVREDPTAFLTERVAFNLCTMYELGCDSTASARKKRVLQLVAKRFFLHDVGPESFRIA